MDARRCQPFGSGIGRGKAPAALAAVLLALFPGNPSATKDTDHQETDRDELVVLPAGTVVDHDYFAVGKIVEISGTVNGDVYAAGRQILVDGSVNGDLLAAGGTVTVSGTVSQDVRAVGGKLTFSGDIGRNATIAGGSIDITPSALFRGNIIAAGGQVELGGLIHRDARIAAGNLSVSNRIGGDLTAAIGNLRLSSKAAVAGNLMYWSRLPASIDPQAVVSGQTIRRTVPKDLLPTLKDVLALLVGFKLVAAAASFMSTLVIGLLLMRLYPASTQRALAHLSQQPLVSLGVGLLGLTAIPLAAGLLAVTVLGIPLAVLLLAWYAIALYVSRVFTIALLGRFAFDRFGVPNRDRWAFIFGLCLYFLLTTIPFLGAFATLLAVLFGLGSVLLMKKDAYVEAGAQRLI
ncbi:MAG TPA: polymer-forming cytoskeletal protein [Nitrospiraceae bacterium]|jgi:cytoskeletal protein CcmA (bactofilin family)|nr:polymer-forming cytoskeletal protein [Nitrospiraceae bacterium]